MKYPKYRIIMGIFPYDSVIGETKQSSGNTTRQSLHNDDKKKSKIDEASSFNLKNA